MIIQKLAALILVLGAQQATFAAFDLSSNSDSGDQNQLAAQSVINSLRAKSKIMSEKSRQFYNLFGQTFTEKDIPKEFLPKEVTDFKLKFQFEKSDPKNKDLKQTKNKKSRFRNLHTIHEFKRGLIDLSFSLETQIGLSAPLKTSLIIKSPVAVIRQGPFSIIYLYNKSKEPKQIALNKKSGGNKLPISDIKEVYNPDSKVNIRSCSLELKTAYANEKKEAKNLDCDLVFRFFKALEHKLSSTQPPNQQDLVFGRSISDLFNPAVSGVYIAPIVITDGILKGTTL